MLIARTHQAADGCWGCVENINFVLLTNVPKARWCRVCWHTLKNKCGGTIGQGPVDDVGMTGHPTNISGAPIDITIMIIKNILVGHGGINQIAT